jgi:sarcosine oxidase delta subunit
MMRGSVFDSGSSHVRIAGVDSTDIRRIAYRSEETPMLFALWVFIFVATLAFGYLLERAEHCRGCGAWFKFHPHRFGPNLGVMCRRCGHVKELQ